MLANIIMTMQIASDKSPRKLWDRWRIYNSAETTCTTHLSHSNVDFQWIDYVIKTLQPKNNDAKNYSTFWMGFVKVT
jgi:hypothetical protein